MLTLMVRHHAMNIFSVYPERYQQQLDAKVDRFQKQLAALGDIPMPVVDVFPSPASHYRMRAEFRVWHQGDNACYAMMDSTTKKPVFLTAFPVAANVINALMPVLLKEINTNTVLRKKLFQIEFLTTLTQDVVVTFIYHAPIEAAWISIMQPLGERLGINIVGRSRKQKVVLGRDFVNEQLQVNDKVFSYQQNEGCFSQPNAKVCEAMLAWMVNRSRHNGGDLLELYCGNGNFTLPLSQNFNRVIATEISKSSVCAAQKNIVNNHILNVIIVRMSSEDFTCAMDNVRPFRRLQQAQVDLSEYQFSTVFVDPPRAGLDQQTINMIQRFDNILYLSCNPTTLIDNLRSLHTTHAIMALAVFDQFPYTDHVEVGAVMKRRR